MSATSANLVKLGLQSWDNLSSSKQRHPPCDSNSRRKRQSRHIFIDGLTQEEIESVRDLCQKMFAAVEAAGGVGAWEDARTALLATVFESNPGLDESDLEKYMTMYGLVSTAV